MYHLPILNYFKAPLPDSAIGVVAIKSIANSGVDTLNMNPMNFLHAMRGIAQSCL
jgi:hypothetical protein